MASKTWVKDLVVEWLKLIGLKVERNVPIETTKSGKKQYASVVGAKIAITAQKDLEIWHVETGRLPSGGKCIKFLEEKFSRKVRAALTEHFKATFNFQPNKSNVLYRREFIATNWIKAADSIDRKLANVYKLQDFICYTIPHRIGLWQKKQIRSKYEAKRKTITLALPTEYKLISLIEYLHDQNLLNRPKLTD